MSGGRHGKHGKQSGSLMKRLLMIGASGHGKVVADIARRNGYQEIAFLDDNPEVEKCGEDPVVGTCRQANELDGDVIVAIGRAQVRRRIQRGIDPRRVVTLIHPSAVVSGAQIGRGTVVMAGAVVNPGAVIGEGCILNTASSVDHDCRIGDYVHIAVGAHVAGGVAIGDETWIGAGATVSNNVSICGRCMIGAGAVVVKDIVEPGTYVGVPAKRLHTGEG